MSFTVSAECWMPSPRLSSAKMLICESLKNGRNGSLFANFTPDAGSHITIDFSPEPWPPWAVATSRVWKAISQSCWNPRTCSIHSSAGFMVWKFAVR